MSNKNNCSIGTLLIKSNKYQSWLQKKPIETFGVVVNITRMEDMKNYSNYEHHLVIKWDDQDGDPEWLESKIFKAHLKSGYIRIASEG